MNLFKKLNLMLLCTSLGASLSNAMKQKENSQTEADTEQYSDSSVFDANSLRTKIGQFNTDLALNRGAAKIFKATTDTPERSLDMLIEAAEKFNNAEATQNLKEIRKSPGYLNPKKATGVNDFGPLLKKVDQDKSLKCYRKFQEIYEAKTMTKDQLADAVTNLINAAELGNHEATQKLEEIRKLPGYLNPKKATGDNDFGPLLKKLDQDKNLECYSEFHRIYDAKTVTSDQVADAVTNLITAAKLGNPGAKAKIKKLKKTNGYNNPKHSKSAKDDEFGRRLYESEHGNIPNLEDTRQTVGSSQSKEKREQLDNLKEFKRERKEIPAKAEQKNKLAKEDLNKKKETEQVFKQNLKQLEQQKELLASQRNTLAEESKSMILPQKTDEVHSKSQNTQEAQITSSINNPNPVPSPSTYEKDNALQQAMRKAVRRGDEVSVLAYIKDGINVNIAGNSGQTPMHLAAKAGNVAILHALYSAGGEVNPKNTHYSSSPLECAIGEGHIKIVRILCDEMGAILPREIKAKEGTEVYKYLSNKIVGTDTTLVPFDPYMKRTLSIKRSYSSKQIDSSSNQPSKDSPKPKALPRTKSLAHINPPSKELKKLERKLSSRDVKRKSNVALTENDILSTLHELQEKGIIELRINGNTINATKKGSSDKLTVHMHDTPDPWNKQKDVITAFLDFVGLCNEPIKQQISQLGKRPELTETDED